VKEALARLQAAWKNLPQSTKLLLAGLLLVGAVTLWYGGLYLPARTPLEAQPPAPAVQETPKALEAPPIPPLAEPAPAEAPKAPEKAEAAQTTPRATNLPMPKAKPEAPPPNPFVPLIVAKEAPPPAPVPTPPAPAPAVRPTPVPTGTPVRVSGGTPLLTPSVQGAPRPLPGTAGALPAPQVLRPTPKVEVPQARLEPPVEVAAPGGLVETPLPQEEPPKEAQAPAPPAPKSPLAALVAEKGLRLSGTLMGPISVAILESKEGYLVLPAGSPIPGSEAVVKRIEGDRIVLALKDETLEIPLEQAGGER